MKSDSGGLSLGIDLVQKSIKKANTPFKRSSSLHIFIEIEIRMRFERDSRDRKVNWATEWMFFNFHATIAASNIIVVLMFFLKITKIASKGNQRPC